MICLRILPLLFEPVLGEDGEVQLIYHVVGYGRYVGRGVPVEIAGLAEPGGSKQGEVMYIHVAVAGAEKTVHLTKSTTPQTVSFR